MVKTTTVSLKGNSQVPFSHFSSFLTGSFSQNERFKTANQRHNRK